MRTQSLLLLMAALLACNSTFAQNVAPSNPTAADLASRISSLEQMLGVIQHDLSDLRQAVHAASRPNETVDATTRHDIDELKGKTDWLARNVHELETVTGQIALKNQSGQYLLNLTETVRQPEAQKQVLFALQQAAPNTGWIMLENRMVTLQRVHVNGVEYAVAPATTLNVSVPAGTATTELPGWEGVKSWFIGAPNFAQRVVISPSAAPAVVMAPSGVTYYVP